MVVTQFNDSNKATELLSSYHKHPCIKLRNQLVETHTGLVRKVAHQFTTQCTEPYEDLVQIGYLGLIYAVERFNPNKGYTLGSFAIPYIRGEILHFLRSRSSNIKIPRCYQELHRQGQKVSQQLTLTLKRYPTDTEIATMLQVSIQEWQNCKLAIQNRTPLSLDKPMNGQEEHSINLGESLVDFRFNNSEEDECSLLLKELNQLPGQIKMVLEMVWIQELSYREVAEKIGISTSTVKRYLQKGKLQLWRSSQKVT